MFFFLFFTPIPISKNIISHVLDGCNFDLSSVVGLGIYGDSNSESEEEQSEHAQIHDDDSDEELKVSESCKQISRINNLN